MSDPAELSDQPDVTSSNTAADPASLDQLLEDAEGGVESSLLDAPGDTGVVDEPNEPGNAPI